MDLLRRLRANEPEVKDPVDTPIPRWAAAEELADNYFAAHPELRTHKHFDGFGDPLHSWTEKRIQAIEATCTECGRVELHSDHAGALKGSKRTVGVVGIKPWSGSAAERAKRDEEWRRYYEAGQTCKAIAAKYAVSEAWVNIVAKENGLGAFNG